MAISPGKGMTFTWGSTAVGQVVAIKPHSPKVGSVETSDISTTSRTHIPTILEPGELSLTLNYDASTATHATFTTDMFAFTSRTALITFADAGAATWASSAFVTSFDLQSVNVDNIATAEVTLKCSGAITITP